MNGPTKGVLIDAQENWECPSCARQHVTTNAGSQVPLHQCPVHAGAWVPFVPAGLKAHLRVNEREDYIGSDTPTTDAEGRVIQSVTTERNDGEDCHIFATTINLDLREP